MEYDIRYLVSLLTEALAEISELNDKVHELEEKVKELSSNHRSSNEVALSNSNTRNIPISQLINTELSDDIKNDIDRAVDFILKYGRNIPYLNK